MQPDRDNLCGKDEHSVKSQTWLQIPALPLISQVTLGKALYLP